MSTQKPSKKSENCRCSGGPPAEWFWEVILCLPDTAVRAESAKKTPPFGWCFWSGRRGSNSLPGIPRMAVAIRRSPASPLDLTRFAQVEAASSPVLRHIPKRIPHPVGWGILFGAGDEARTRYRHPTNGCRHSWAPCLTSDQTCFAQVEAATSSLPAVSFQKRKSHPDGWDFLFWSGRRGSNSLPRPWQGRALPDELRPQTQD